MGRKDKEKKAEADQPSQDQTPVYNYTHADLGTILDRTSNPGEVAEVEVTIRACEATADGPIKGGRRYTAIEMAQMLRVMAGVMEEAIGINIIDPA